MQEGGSNGDHRYRFIHAPADGSIYVGGLGNYNVGWTKASGNPGFFSIKFEPLSKNYKNGATELFTIVVTNFNPGTAIQVRGVGPSQETFSFVLSQTNCATSTATLNQDGAS